MPRTTFGRNQRLPGWYHLHIFKLLSEHSIRVKKEFSWIILFAQFARLVTAEEDADLLSHVWPTKWFSLPHSLIPSILSFCDSGCWRHQLSWVPCSVSHHLGWSRELLSPSCFPFPLCCYASGSLLQVNVDWHNLKSQVCTGCIWLILGSRNLSWSPWVLWSDEERMNMLDGCHHVYLDMGTNTGVQIRFNILGINSWVYTNKGSSRYGCI